MSEQQHHFNTGTLRCFHCGKHRDDDPPGPCRLPEQPEQPSAAGPVLDLLDMAVDAIDAIRSADVDTTTWEEATHLLVALRSLITRARAVEDNLTRHIAARMPTTPTAVDGVGLVQVRKGQLRKAWHSDELTRDVIRSHMERRGGEVPSDPYEVVRWVLDAAAIGYWRKSALTDLGLDVDDYCDTTPGRKSIQIT